MRGKEEEERNVGVAGGAGDTDPTEDRFQTAYCVSLVSWTRDGGLDRRGYLRSPCEAAAERIECQPGADIGRVEAKAAMLDRCTGVEGKKGHEAAMPQGEHGVLHACQLAGKRRNRGTNRSEARDDFVIEEVRLYYLCIAVFPDFVEG